MTQNGNRLTENVGNLRLASSWIDKKWQEWSIGVGLQRAKIERKIEQAIKESRA